MWSFQGISKGESGLFLTPVLTLWGDDHWPSRMEAGYCTFGFGAIIRHDLCTQEKQPSCLTKLLCGFNYEKIRRYNNSPPHVTARWPLQQIPLLLQCAITIYIIYYFGRLYFDQLDYFELGYSIHRVCWKIGKTRRKKLSLAFDDCLIRLWAFFSCCIAVLQEGLYYLKTASFSKKETDFENDKQMWYRTTEQLESSHFYQGWVGIQL